MTSLQPLAYEPWSCAFGWMLLLAALPWWCAWPLQVALAAAVAMRRAPLPAWPARLALHAGLAGVLWSTQRALGGDLRAWCLVALLVVLVGGTLLAGIEGWLDRAQAPPTMDDGDAWPQRAFAPMGPADTLIELEPPQWHEAEVLVDPRGGGVRRERDGWRLGDGTLIEAAAGVCAFGGDGRWFATVDRRGRRLVLWRRGDAVPHRGWHRGEPWIARHAQAMPRPSASVSPMQRRWSVR